MAKKKTKKVEVEPQIETMEEVVTEFFEEPMVQEVTVEPTKEQLKELVIEEKPRERIKPKNEWEIKDRIYHLKGNKKPLSSSK